MLKIADKDDYNAMLQRYEEVSSSVAGASIRILTSHFVALWPGRGQYYAQQSLQLQCFAVGLATSYIYDLFHGGFSAPAVSSQRDSVPPFPPFPS